MTGAVARAVRFDRFGGSDVLYLADLDMPSPGSGEVVVEVRAAGVNPGEALIRTGALHRMFPKRFSATFPAGEGNDLAGVVASVGPEVSQFSVGDEVLGFSLRRDRHATHIAVPVAQLIRKPAQLSWEIAVCSVRACGSRTIALAMWTCVDQLMSASVKRVRARWRSSAAARW
jgi:NADPH:quinone reductase-like Zn-dependent oxidoreductase